MQELPQIEYVSTPPHAFLLLLGENMGWGGELVTAQFLVTGALDNETLARTGHENSNERTGLFIDARYPQGAELVRMIMESEHLTKLIWGADGDLVSLRHQGCLPVAAAMFESIRSTNVIDVQLGFSDETKRLGMARMIERVPSSNPTLRRLPSKELSPTFYSSFGKNKRCFPLPLSNELALYSVDDLHRIEVILQTRDPDVRNFTAAKTLTLKIISSLESPSSSVVRWVARERQHFGKKYGSKKQEKAVQLARAVRHAELAFGASLSGSDKRDLDSALKLVTIALDANGVDIPSDLSFHD
jgi:hypothetical protein